MVTGALVKLLVPLLPFDIEGVTDWLLEFDFELCFDDDDLCFELLFDDDFDVTDGTDDSNDLETCFW